MEFTGEQRIAAPRETVFRALNDPAILKQAIPGCRELEKTSETEMDAVVRVKVGPVQATFKSQVELSDIDPPNGYVITGTGSAGAAGFAKGQAKVQLEDDGGGTRLRYTADADLGGKIAQLGGRLIQSTADRLSARFFEAFKDAVEAAEAPPAEAAAEEEAATAAEPPAPAPQRWLWWAVAGAAAILLLVIVLLA